MSVVLVAYAMPADARHYVSIYSDLSENIDLEGTSNLIQESITRQTNLPVIELGAMIFYSGNIVIDLLLNFAFAIPQMLGLFVNGVFTVFNIDSYIFAIVQLFASVAVIVWYFITLIQLLTNTRSGRIT